MITSIKKFIMLGLMAIFATSCSHTPTPKANPQIYWDGATALDQEYASLAKQKDDWNIVKDQIQSDADIDNWNKVGATLFTNIRENRQCYQDILATLRTNAIVLGQDAVLDRTLERLARWAQPLPTSDLGQYYAQRMQAKYPLSKIVSVGAGREMYPVLDWDTIVVVLPTPKTVKDNDIVYIQTGKKKTLVSYFARVQHVEEGMVTVRGDNVRTDVKVLPSQIKGVCVAAVYYIAKAPATWNTGKDLVQTPPNFAPQRRSFHTQLIPSE